MMGEGDNIRLVLDKLWDNTSRLEGWSGSEGLQPVTLRCTSHTEAHLKTYRDESGAPEVIEVTKETSQRRGVPIKKVIC